MTFERMKAAHDKLAQAYLDAVQEVKKARGLFVADGADIKAAYAAEIRFSKFKIRGGVLMRRRTSK